MAVEITTPEQFETALSSSDLVVIHFYADWCDQHADMKTMFDELVSQNKHENIKYYYLPAEDLPEISYKCSITAVPTFVIFSSQKEVHRLDGANAAELHNIINNLPAKTSNAPQTSNASQSKAEVPSGNSLNVRLKKLINSAPIMVFIKGDALQPRCGFSKQIIGILREHNAEFKTFDILGDEEVRQGLKEYSSWPTYPQLYVKGEFIGGVDIVRELHDQGELTAVLNPVDELNERLRQLVNEHRIMVFMKGSRDAAKCGFSRTLMTILEETGLDFKTFDILEDNEVREGLKTYSDWPTYPQVYVGGVFIGGLDIIKELKETGMLDFTLKG